jgi:hypothetical protein
MRAMETVVIGPRPPELDEVDEALIAGPGSGRLLRWVLGDGGYRPVERSGLLDVADLAAAVAWPSRA